MAIGIIEVGLPGSSELYPIGQHRTFEPYVGTGAASVVTYYRMRGIDITCPAIQQPAYVYWTVQDSPDWGASQLAPGDLPCGTDPLTDVADIQVAGVW